MAQQTGGNDMHRQLSDARAEVKELKDALRISEETRTADIVRLESKVKIAEEMIERLQKPRADSSLAEGPAGALGNIIRNIGAVAMGGSAALLREAVRMEMGKLNYEDKLMLNDYALRLQGAAEAVKQETSGLAIQG